jgi:HlyD family secretion protein
MRKITIFILTSCLVAMSGCSKKEESEAEAPAPVQVTAVTQDTIRRIVAGDGMLFPRDQASVMPKIASPVEKFYVNRGDHVKQGQLLAVLENRDLTAQAAEGQGAMDQAESNLRTTSGASVPEAVVKAQTDVDADRQAMDAAKKVFDSREQLFKQGALAQRQVDEALVSYTQAKASSIPPRSICGCCSPSPKRSRSRPLPRRWNPPRRIINRSRPSSAIRAFSAPSAG